MVLIDLGKETQAEAVANAWEEVLELPDQSRQTLPPNKKISNIFNEMNRALLILGEPGSGKTITLLQLAKELIVRAEQDDSFTQPVPVVFNLSTWRQGQTMVNWLASELSAKYQIPQRIGQSWLEGSRLLPLLDGLDEVKPTDRSHCVEAINYFCQEIGLSGLAVCSRLEAYLGLPVRLTLNGVIRLQPLTLEQVYDYLEMAGSRLEALRIALETDDSLRTLAQTPLTLGIMILAYQDVAAESLVDDVNNNLATRREQLLNTYVERMFARRGKGKHLNSNEQSSTWLSWLAQGMIEHSKSIFLIEQLQPSWLASRMWVWMYVLTSRLGMGLIAGVMVGLLMGVSEVWLRTRTQLAASGLSGWLMFGVIWGVTIGLLVALIDGIRLERGSKQATPTSEPSFFQKLLHIIVIWVILGTANGIIFGLTIGPLFGVAAVFLFGGAGTVLLLLRGRQPNLSNDIQTVEALGWSWQKARKVVLIGLIIGIVYGLLASWIFFGDQDFVITIMKDAPIYNSLGRNGLYLSEATFWGVLGSVVAAILGGLSGRVEAAKIKPNQGIRLTFRNAALVGLGFGPFIGLMVGVMNGLFYGSWSNALTMGLAFFIGIGTAAFGIYGGVAVIQHYTLRFILWITSSTPLNYARFLDYATDLIFLQKVGGGYIFIHRLLLEHFASLEATQEM